MSNDISVRVRPLVWDDWSARHRTNYTAETPFGRYGVIQFYFPDMHFKIEPPSGKPFIAASIDAAKAAAQADYERRILTTLEPVPVTPAEAARVLLAAYDGFLDGRDQTEAEKELMASVAHAACFAATAYDAGMGGGNDVHALARSFLIALIDTNDVRLDYLRADPKAGQIARDAALRALADAGEADA